MTNRNQFLLVSFFIIMYMYILLRNYNFYRIDRQWKYLWGDGAHNVSRVLPMIIIAYMPFTGFINPYFIFRILFH